MLFILLRFAIIKHMKGGMVSPSSERVPIMFALITFEYETSEAVIREGLPMSAAYKIASNGGFYKAQIVNEWGVIEYEF